MRHSVFATRIAVAETWTFPVSHTLFGVNKKILAQRWQLVISEHLNCAQRVWHPKLSCIYDQGCSTFPGKTYGASQAACKQAKIIFISTLTKH